MSRRQIAHFVVIKHNPVRTLWQRNRLLNYLGRFPGESRCCRHAATNVVNRGCIAQKFISGTHLIEASHPAKEAVQGLSLVERDCRTKWFSTQKMWYNEVISTSSNLKRPCFSIKRILRQYTLTIALDSAKFTPTAATLLLQPVTGTYH